MVMSVVKVGTSSITGESGELDDDALVKLCGEIAATRECGHEVVLVSSGAIAAGMPALGITERPTDVGMLQAIAAVGQPRLMERMSSILAGHGLVSGQVLLTAYDFGERDQYLHARATLRRLLDLGVVPVVNENDTVADDEIRYGDNDRLAALVANLVGAEVLVLLTDTAGLYTADPRLDSDASLIEEIVEVDAALESVAGGAGTQRGSGGMASKLAAAKIAAWSGVRVVIAAAGTPGVVLDAVEGRAVGTAVRPRSDRLTSRKLWIAFARGARGRITVDSGAARALCEQDRSLLPAGVVRVEGTFEAGDAIEVVDEHGIPFAKGLTRYSSKALGTAVGKKTKDLDEGSPHEVVHKDDLVVLP
ncbi:MAG: glutamate 5-kinase [Acidimicrobiia bacterium]|nr:glutamate 5-kinase [Acidimicrobiia bacterium]